jgi:hypothetical protein
MEYGNYEYRIVIDQLEEYYILQLFELNGVYYFVSKKPQAILGYNLDQLKTNFNMHYQAFEKPTLPIDSIKDIHDLPLHLIRGIKPPPN